MDAVNKQFLSAQLFIDGKFVDAASGETMDIINPADGAVIGTLSKASAEDVGRAVKCAHDAFESGVWRDMPFTQRSRILNRFADLFEADLENFYKLETLNNGRRSLRRARRFRACRSFIDTSRRLHSHAVAT